MLLRGRTVAQCVSTSTYRTALGSLASSSRLSLRSCSHASGASITVDAGSGNDETIMVDGDSTGSSHGDRVEFKVVANGLGSMLHVDLPADSHVVCASGRAVGFSDHVTSTASLNGLRGNVGRTLSGENFLMQRLKTPPAAKGTALIAPEGLGDIACIRLTGDSDLLLRKGAFVASSPGVRLSGRITDPNYRSEMGLFTLQAGGKGLLALTTHGGIFRIDVGEGERFELTKAHMVAWDSSVRPKPMGAGRAHDATAWGWAMSLLKRPFQVSTPESEKYEVHGPGSIYVSSRTKPPTPPSKGLLSGLVFGDTQSRNDVKEYISIKTEVRSEAVLSHTHPSVTAGNPVLTNHADELKALRPPKDA